jgi:hypothetical protein
MIRLDYNAETDDGQFFAQRSRLGSLPAVGQLVPTHDSDGNSLNVIVDRTENGLVYFQPLWSTWCAAEDLCTTELTSASASSPERQRQHRPPDR